MTLFKVPTDHQLNKSALGVCVTVCAVLLNFAVMETYHLSVVNSCFLMISSVLVKNIYHSTDTDELSSTSVSIFFTPLR